MIFCCSVPILEVTITNVSSKNSLWTC